MTTPVREVQNALTDRGYRMFRQGGKHSLWTNGIHRVTLHSGSRISARNVANFMADLERNERDKPHVVAFNHLLACLKDPCEECKKAMAAAAAADDQYNWKEAK